MCRMTTALLHIKNTTALQSSNISDDPSVVIQYAALQAVSQSHTLHSVMRPFPKTGMKLFLGLC